MKAPASGPSLCAGCRHGLPNFRRSTSNIREQIRSHHAHQESFDLEHPLNPKEINSKQHPIGIGSAADEGYQCGRLLEQTGGLRSASILIESMNWAAIIISSFSHCPTTDTNTQPIQRASCLTRIEAGTKSRSWYIIENAVSLRSETLSGSLNTFIPAISFSSPTNGLDSLRLLGLRRVGYKLLILTHRIEMWNSLHRSLRGTSS